MILVTEALIALNVQNYKLEGNPTSEEEFNNSFVKIVGSDENEIAIESTNPEDFGITWAEVVAKMEALVTEKPLAQLREERDRRIAETDWWVLADRTPTQPQLSYRQALRDITKTYSSLNDVIWPEKP